MLRPSTEVGWPPFFVESLVVDTEPLIDDRNPRIEMSFARIVDRDPRIDDTNPLIAIAKLQRNC